EVACAHRKAFILIVCARDNTGGINVRYGIMCRTVFMRDEPVICAIGVRDEDHRLGTIGKRRYRNVRTCYISKWGRRTGSTIAGQRHVYRCEEDIATRIEVCSVGENEVLIGLTRNCGDNGRLIS